MPCYAFWEKSGEVLQHGDPKIVVALDLLKSEFLGMEDFEILLDKKLSVI